MAATAEAPNVGNLWLGAWIASFVIGGLVWGLIGWAVIRYRRKDGDVPAPRQTTYHLPLELLYTLVPFLIIGVLFFYTVKAQDAMLDQSEEPDVVIGVIGQKWSWTFNYMEEDNPDIGTNAHTVGMPEGPLPELYLPVNKRVRFDLQSADVIHSFWVPSFYFKESNREARRMDRALDLADAREAGRRRLGYDDTSNEPRPQGDRDDPKE